MKSAIFATFGPPWP